jgi:hypothetical protein
MSVSSLTNVAMSRRADVDSSEAVPNSQSGFIAATAGPQESRNGVAGAMQVIMTYVPTEIIGVYTSVATAIQVAPGSNQDTSNYFPAWIAFAICLFLTPLSVLLLYAGKVKQANKPLSLSPTKWPLWEMSAASLAFFAWAFSMPGSPFRSIQGFYSPGIAAIVLPCSAMIIGMVAPLMHRELKS